MFFVCWLCVLFFFFFKQKTAYEMRISDWSSDVCSSDLKFIAQHADAFVELAGGVGLVRVDLEDELLAFVEFDIGMEQRVDRAEALCVLCKIGRASCRERVCQYV